MELLRVGWSKVAIIPVAASFTRIRLNPTFVHGFVATWKRGGIPNNEDIKSYIISELKGKRFLCRYYNEVGFGKLNSEIRKCFSEKWTFSIFD